MIRGGVLSYISLVSAINKGDVSKYLTTNIDFYSIDDSTFIDYDNLVSMGDIGRKEQKE